MELLLILIGCAIDVAFIIIDNKHHNWVSIVLKTLASLVFVFLGIYESRNLLSSQYAKFIWASLLFDLLGDFTLILRNVDKKHKDLIFIVGTFFFLISHIFLIVLFIIKQSNYILVSILITLLLFIIMYYFVARKMKASTKIMLIGSIYLYIILFVFIYSLIVCINNFNTFYLVFTIGYFLFMISDIVLSIHKFSKDSKEILQPIYRILYYASQIIIAISVKFMDKI